MERLWHVRKRADGAVLSCGLYLHPHGIEVRCGFQDEANLLMSEVAKTPDEARARADEWKATAISKGFTEHTSDERSDVE